MNLPLWGFIILVLMVLILFFLSKRARLSSGVTVEAASDTGEQEVKDIETLIKQLKTGKTEEKIASIEQLMKLFPPGLGELLVQAMGDKNEQVKMAAARALIQLKDPETVPLLVEALKEPGRWLPARVAEVLTAIGTPAVPTLKGVIAGGDEAVRPYAVQILGMLDITETTSVLLDCLKDPSVDVRRAAATALADRVPDGALSVLTEAVKDSDAKVRIQAAKALGATGSEDAIEALEQAAGDQEWVVAASAMGALARIGGKGADVLKKIARDQDHPGQKQALALVGENEKKAGAVVNISYGAKE